MLEDTTTEYTGTMDIARKLYNACEAAKENSTKIQEIVTSWPIIPAVSVTALDYMNVLAKAGVTNFGVYKLDLAPLNDITDVNPKAVLVIQDRAKYDTSDKFGYENITNASLIATDFDGFDSVENRASSNNELFMISKYADALADNKMNPLMGVLTGWFPPNTPVLDILAKVWTYDYAYWSEVISFSSFPYELTKKQFHHFIASKSFEKSMTEDIFTPKDCHAFVVKTIPQAFAKYTADEASKKKVEKLTKLFDANKGSIDRLLKSSDLDQATQNMLSTKVEGIQLHVGYPEKMETGLDIATLTGTNMSDIVAAYPAIKNWQLKQHFKYLLKPNDNYPAFYSFYNQMTRYDKDTNILYVHPQLLEDPFFDNEYPPYIGYGDIGRLIAKELSNAVTLFDTSSGVKDTLDCLNDTSYGDASLEQSPTGKTYLDEMMADNIGTLSAYQLMKQDEARGIEEGRVDVLPGLEKYDDGQMFFLSLAKRLCTSPIDGLTIKSKDSDLKGLGKRRVNGIVSNMEEFGKAFGCEEGKPMNPVKKCKSY